MNKEITIKPNQGMVNPGKSQNIQLIWSPTTLRPKNNSIENDRVKLQIIDGFDKIIQIQTHLPLAKCTLSNKHIKLTKSPLALNIHKEYIKNTGHIQAIYRIIRLPSGLSVHPLYGKIEIGTSKSLSITYLSCRPQKFS